VSDPSDQDSILSAFELGPSWARESAPAKTYDDHRGEDPDARRGRGRRDDRRGGGGGGGRRDGGGGRGRRDGGGGQRGRRDGPPGKRELPEPAPGVKVTLAPDKDAVHKIVKEIHHVARVYSLFDISQILLADRSRYRLQVKAGKPAGSMWRGRRDDSLFLSKEEAVAHFWQNGPVEEFYDTEEVETEPPSGNFQVVARCGISGEWLGPPNFHGYQAAIRRLHRERFANMSFDRYAAKVRTERGEEAVNEWLETMKVRRRWRPKGGGDEDWSFDRSSIEHDFLSRAFGEVYEEVRETELPGDVPALHVSIGILAAIRIAGAHARRHPAMLIPTICRMLEAERLAVFKKQGKLYSGPARPHPLDDVGALSERPKRIVDWLDAHDGSKLADLWQAVLPADSEGPPREWLVDLFWLLSQGHVLLFSDDTLVLPKRRAQQPGQAKAGKAKKAAKAAPKSGAATPKPAETGTPPAPGAKRTRKGRGPKLKGAAKRRRRISRMNPGELKALRGRDRLIKRQLERRERIESLLEE